jgi:hypothetical protein
LYHICVPILYYGRKVTNKRAENQILFGFFEQEHLFCTLAKKMWQMLGGIENNAYICSRYQ